MSFLDEYPYIHGVNEYIIATCSNLSLCYLIIMGKGIHLFKCMEHSYI